MSQAALPERFATVEALEDFMTTPSPQLVADLRTLSGDILVLGVGGKMGPTLARLAKRAAPLGKRVIGVARFSEPGVREALASRRSRSICSTAARSSACPRRPMSCSWPVASSARPATCRSPGR